MDQAHEWTDEQIERLRRRFRRTYAQAAREMRTKLDTLMAEYEKANEEWKDKVKSGKATQEEYDAWLKDQAMDRSFVGGMVETLAQDAVNADKLAMGYVNDVIPQVYAENANYAAYQIEKAIGSDTHSFDLYDQSAVRRLVAEPDAPLLPKPRVDARKDKPWNRRKMNSAITQSILQGESIPNVAKRLQAVLKMDEAAATRAARTAMTGAENAGRIDSYRRAERIGIRLEQQWMATLDERTRMSHRELDGRHVPVGEYFIASKTTGNRLLYPGDPSAPAEDVYGCRCTLVAWFPGIEQEDPKRWSDLPKDMTYDEWKSGKKDSGETTEGRQHGSTDTSDAVAEVRSGRTSSLGKYLSDDGRLTTERELVHRRIIDEKLAGKIPVDGQPTMTMLGGGPASGKSSVMSTDTSQNVHAVTIDPDDMKRMLPGFTEMADRTSEAASFYHEESSALAKRLAQVSYSEGYDVIYDGTGDGSIDSVMHKIADARAGGYRVNATYVSVDTDEAVRRNRERYESAIAKGQTPRLVPESYVRSCHAKCTDISVAMAPEFDHIEIWDNSGKMGSQVLIAEGGSGRYLSPVPGQEETFMRYLAKGMNGISGFEIMPDGQVKPTD